MDHGIRLGMETNIVCSYFSHGNVAGHREAFMREYPRGVLQADATFLSHKKKCLEHND